MGIKNRCVSALLAVGVLSSYSAQPMVLIESYAETKQLNENLLNKISMVRTSFNDYKVAGNIESLKQSIKSFGDLAEFIQEEKEVEAVLENPMYSLFLDIREELYLIANSTGSGQYILDYANSILEGWKKNRHMTVFSRIFMVEGIIEYNKGKVLSIDEELEKIKKYYEYLLPIEWESPEHAPSKEWFEEMMGNISVPEGDFSGPMPDFDTGVAPTPPTYEDMGQAPDIDDIWDEDAYTTDTYYQKENNKCMLVTRIFKENMVIETTKKEVAKEDYVYCGIYDYIFDNVTYIPTYEVEIDEEYIGTDQNIESNNYIYYTDNKNAMNPYYYNTGIRATLNKSVTYNQLKDVLYQIALKVKGFSIDSNDKTLTILEGKPIVLESKNEKYTKEQVESLLDDFKLVDIKIQEYTDEITSLNTAIYDYIEENSSVDLMIGENKITLTDIKVSNSVLITSLNEIASVLNLQVEKSAKTYKVSGKNNYIKFALGTTSYKNKNNQEKKFLIETSLKNGNVYIDFKTLLEEMGYVIEWDNESLNILVEEKIDN